MTVPADRPAVVSWLGGVRFEAAVRGHRLIIDQPREEGGTDQGITPIECLAVSVGTCVAFFVVRFCERHNLAPRGVRLTVEWGYAEQPHRVGGLRVAVEYDGVLEPALRERLLKVAEGCTVHQTLAHPPEIRVLLTTTEGAHEPIV